MEQTDSLAALLERSLKQAGRAEVLAEELEATRAEMTRRESLLKQRLAAQENASKAREAELAARLAAFEGKEQRQLEGALVAANSKAAAIEADYKQRVQKAQEELAKVTAECLKARADLSDLRLRMTRVQNDQATLNSLTRQQEGEVVVLRGRLQQLLASRWRRYGQRVGLCMTMPWERELLNGKH